MTGSQKFVGVAAFLSKGRIGAEVSTVDIKKHWLKSALQVSYNPAFYDRSQKAGWVDPVSGKRGTLHVTQAGLDNLVGLLPETNAGEYKKSGSLMIVNRKAIHTFDKFLRQTLSASKAQVFIADSWVDDKIFDTVLDVIPQTRTVRLIYAQARGSFGARAQRFGRQYTRFASKRYKHLHDRFMIVDDIGYILGPSIKDAASNSPALVVILAEKETNLLQKFFNDLWANTKSK